MSSTTNIVVIGGSYGGLGVAQGLVASIPKAKVTLISTSKDYYFNIAAPRILAKPKSTPLEKVIFPIKETFFSKCPTTQFEFIHATATALDTTAKTISLSNSTTVNYDYLVIASGSHTLATEGGIPVKQSLTDNLHESISSAQTAIVSAPSIVIGGGGAVAVEIAGEIAEAYPQKEVTLVSGSERLLASLSVKASQIASKQLQNLGVTVIFGAKVVGDPKTSSPDGSKELSVELDNGQILKTGLYIPAVGIIPNSGFIPAPLLDSHGYLVTDAEQKVSADPAVPNIYGVGDVTTNPNKMAAAIKVQVAVVVANLKSDIEGGGKREEFKEAFKGMVVPIGGKGGVAEMGGVVLWSFAVWLIKGNYFIPMALMISGLKKR